MITGSVFGMHKPPGNGGLNGVQGSFKPCRANSPQETNRFTQHNRKEDAMPTDVTSSNAPADIMRGLQTVLVPGTLQVRSGQAAIHLQIVSIGQLVLPMIGPNPERLSPLALDLLAALHQHLHGLNPTASLHLSQSLQTVLVTHSPIDHLPLERYLQLVLKEIQNLQHTTNPQTALALEVLDQCLVIASQILAIVHHQNRESIPEGRVI
jgi:hypothetical protein